MESFKTFFKTFEISINLRFTNYKTENKPLKEWTFCILLFTGLLPFFVFGFKSYTLPQLILNFICGILHIGAILSLMIAYQMAEAHKLAYVQYIQIFLGFILGYLIFNEVPGIFIYLGCSLILISVTFIVKEAKNSRL